MNFSLVAAVNSDLVLESCLMKSPDINSAFDLILQRGYKDASAAYNAALDQAANDIVVFAHQDVYFPQGWFDLLRKAIAEIERSDPNWGVLGVWGAKVSGELTGHLYCGACGKVLGNAFRKSEPVQTLDEVVLVLKKSSGLRFDSRLRGFHMYGADICLQARARNRNCYAVPAFCIHNTSQYGMLPMQFWKAYWLLRNKWKALLPVYTSCTQVTYFCWPMFRWNIVRAINLVIGRDPAPRGRVGDAVQLYRELMSCNPELVGSES